MIFFIGKKSLQNFKSSIKTDNMLKQKLFFAFAFIINATIHAQLSEINLNNPNNGVLSGNDLERTIYYGSTPNKWNGKTIVFAHGFTATSSVFIDGSKTLYKWAYNDGYKTVFITTTKGESMETNAELFAKGLEQIKTKLGTSRFYMIAHSNGGKSIDLALSVYEKRDMAIKVVTLGTPFRGTPIANVGQWPVLNWVASLSSIDEGMKTSTTYYMENVRETVDYLPYNDPGLFYHFGHTGYNQFFGTDLPTFAKYSASGSLIKVLGGGNNDGVTPYYSHYKPGGYIVVPEGQGGNNHSTLTHDFKIWEKIKQIFTEDSPLYSSKENRTSSFTEYSNYQLVYNEKPEFTIKDDTEKYEVISLKEKNNADEEPYNENYTKGEHKIKDNGGKYLNIYVSSENKGFLLEKDILNERLVIKDIQNMSIKGSQIKAEAYLLPKEAASKDLGRALPIYFKYNAAENGYSAFLNSFPKGVYTMSIHVDNEYYSRDLISGFVIGKIELGKKKSESTISIKNNKKGEAVVVKNPATGSTAVKIQEIINTPVTISIFDLSGKLISQNTYKDFSGFTDLPSPERRGLYIIKVSYNGKDVNLKYIP